MLYDIILEPKDAYIQQSNHTPRLVDRHYTTRYDVIAMALNYFTPETKTRGEHDRLDHGADVVKPDLSLIDARRAIRQTKRHR